MTTHLIVLWISSLIGWGLFVFAQRIIAARDERIKRLEGIITHFEIHSTYKGGAIDKLTEHERIVMRTSVSNWRKRHGIED